MCRRTATTVAGNTVLQEFQGREKSHILPHVIVLEQWNIKSSIFAYHILAFLTLRCAYIGSVETIFWNIKNIKMWNVSLYHILYEKQVIISYQY